MYPYNPAAGSIGVLWELVVTRPSADPPYDSTCLPPQRKCAVLALGIKGAALATSSTEAVSPRASAFRMVPVRGTELILRLSRSEGALEDVPFRMRKDLDACAYIQDWFHDLESDTAGRF